ncbi:hypothetical protein [Frigoriglobus tundricola]|uniref:hypothetical protein n=1 Tax=Frigoriglobus tundricola TaxID=2774151 RepID=UPI00148EE16E|nr:hypothetical protein [Frigoriglobus tundricola]
MPSSSTHEPVPVRLSLFRCDRCGGVIPVTPTEVRACAREAWPQCCGADLTLYIEAERPARDATEVIALPLALPGGNPGTDTVILAPPAARKLTHGP